MWDLWWICLKVGRDHGDVYIHVSSTIWYGRTYGTQYERGWYSEGKRATRSAKELENGDLSKSM